MDIESFKSAIGLWSQALTLVKKAKDLLPASPQKEVATKTIEEAEKAFKIAEANAAKELGYPLCKCTWPPQIMLSSGESGDFKCSKCSSVTNNSAVSVSLDPPSRKRFFSGY